jgi:signal peptidase II
MISAGLLFLDQLSKLLLTGKSYVFNGFLSIQYTQNLGASFGILQGGRWLFIATALIVIYIIFKFYRTFRDKTGLMFLLAGAVGNLLDRVLFGYVRDFISIWIWPTFNLADAFSVIGVALLAWQMIKEERKHKKNL